MNNQGWQAKARVAFVKLIKEENFYSDFSKQSLKQHWSGAAGGFSDCNVQTRWQDFLSGWQAAKEQPGTDPPKP